MRHASTAARYDVRQIEPEGWAKAFEVTKDGEHVAYCSFRDTADRIVTEGAAKCLALRGEA